MYMENQTNVWDQNTSQQNGQSPTNQLPVNPSLEKQKVNYLLIGSVILICLVTFGSGGYYLGTKKNQQNNNAPIALPTSSATTEVLSPTNPATPTTQPSVAAYDWIKFTHPVAGYSFEYPRNWKGGIQAIPEGIKTDYQDFIITSPDYKTSEGFPFLEQGAELFVRVEKTTKDSIEDIFSSDPLASQIATGKTSTIVDGQRAIQYDYSYEGHVATMTQFVKNGIHYTVKFRYPDKDSKQALWNDYLKLLASFRTE